MHLPMKFIHNRIDEYAMQVTYNPAENNGKIIYNLSIIKEEDREYALQILKDAYHAGISVSNQVRFLDSGETLEGYTIPARHVGICTMCSLTLDGLLLKKGIPLRSIGGGVVEVQDRMPRRFTHFILYEHTTIDPLEVLVAQEITSIAMVMRKGRGTILGNIRECHMESESRVSLLLDDLASVGFTGILDLGVPNVPLLGVPVSPQYFGVAMVGGTNAMAAIKEGGRPVITKALKGLMDVSSMEYITDY
jgi:repressor of nif and glnA expression